MTTPPKRRTAILAVLAVLCGALPAATQSSPGSAPAGDLRQGPRLLRIPYRGHLVVTKDSKIEPGVYLRPAVGDDGRDGVILLENLSGVTLDLTGVILRGNDHGAPLDESRGWGIVVRGCADVTIRGGLVSGYKGCLVAENSTGLVLDGIRFDSWYGQRLLSSVAAENQADWLVPGENDLGEWLEYYGAAISLSSCSKAVVRNCKGRRGQNGILLTRTNESQVYDNDFSFMSGWGIAMHRSTDNVVARNRFDYCVRGYSHDVYWRGQDSAAILMFERSSDNLVAYNSATHSGAGLILFGGLDGGAIAAQEGDQPIGSDRNVFYQNDFSYAVTNGIEATLSTGNRVIENVLRGCRHDAVMGRYTRGMVLIGNLVEDTVGAGITIEQGQDCIVERNVMHGNEIGLELFWDEDRRLVRGVSGDRFGRSSSGHFVLGNSFSKNDSDLQIHATTGILFAENVYDTDVRRIHASQLSNALKKPMGKLKLLERLRGIGGWMPSGHISQTSILPCDHESLATLRESGVLDYMLPAVPGSQVAYENGAAEPGLESIVMGEWGPGISRAAPRARLRSSPAACWPSRPGRPCGSAGRTDRIRAGRPGTSAAGARWRTRR